MVKINGTELDITDKSVAEYIAENNFDIKCVAVEFNGDILPKSHYETTMIKDGDNIEIVSFVGGG